MLLRDRIFAKLLIGATAIGCSGSLDLGNETAGAQADTIRFAKTLTAEEVNELISAAAQEASRSLTQSEPQNVSDQPTLSLPAVEGWNHGEFRRIQGAGEGFSADYESAQNAIATIFVYDRGLVAIPNDVSSPEVVGDFENAKSQIKEAVALGLYSAATEERTGVVRIGADADAPMAHFAFYTIDRRDARVSSRIYLTVLSNQFVKLRFTYPHNDAECEGDIDRLIAVLRASWTM